ncbi:MAG TPA: hypothetical protein VKB10_10375 [Gaiellaceae bacterium]|nr:hypothetical protein [Gaiellaceae bacterium]
MAIGSWWKKLRAGRDAEAVERAEARSLETAEERRFAADGMAGREADQRAARSMHEPNLRDAERLGDAD